MQRLPLSAPGTLLTLSQRSNRTTSEPLRWPVVVARSYDGNQWELARKPSAVVLAGCDATGCNADIPSGAAEYVLDSWNGSATNDRGSLPLEAYVRRVAARHLMRSSFGPTNRTVEELAAQLLQHASPPPPLCSDGFTIQTYSAASMHGDVCRKDDGSGAWEPPSGCERAGGRWSGKPWSAMPYTGGTGVPCDHSQLMAKPLAESIRAGLAAHVAEQIAQPPSLHRAYSRERSNPRIDHHHHRFGPIRSACERGSRWHAAGFTVHDVGSYVSITMDGGTAILLVNNVARTELPEGWVTPYTPPPPSPPPHPNSPPLPALSASPREPAPALPPSPTPPSLWQVCTVEEGIGLKVVLGRKCQCNTIGGITGINSAQHCYARLTLEPMEIYNPPITFSAARTPTDTMFVSTANATITELPGVAGDCPPGYRLLASISRETSNDYGYRCISPVNSTECPKEVDLTDCDKVRPNGALCHGPEFHFGRRIYNCDHPAKWDASHTAVYRAVATGRSHVLIMTELRAPCSLSPKARHSDAFLVYDGVFYHYDQRLQMVENTLEAPTNLSNIFEHSLTRCPNVRKTFLNAQTCVRRRTCSGLQFSNVQVQLNHSIIRRFYEVSNLYVYVTVGLRDGWDNYHQTLCSWYSTTRWMNIGRAAPSTNVSTASDTSGQGNVTHPSQCVSGRCCGVLFKGAAGSQCNPVPIWDFTSWTHPGSGAVTNDRLCGQIKYDWLSKSATHAYRQDPEDTTLQSLDHGAIQVGQYVDSACSSSVPPPSPPITTVPCTSTLDADTVASIVQKLNTTDTHNQFVRDIKVVGCNGCREPCSAPSAPVVAGQGARVELDGNCWQHVHSNMLDVRDFTFFSMMHDGNTGAFKPITRFAIDGGTELRFPSSHSMNRWNKKQSHAKVLGRLGDTVAFSALPAEVQTLAMAEELGGRTNLDNHGTEVCGSPGEVANRPEYGHRIASWISLLNLGDEGLFRDYKHGGVARRMVHTARSLYAPDQLRQRVAWALSQIYVIGTSGLEGFGDKNEIWHSYYDIFVRHAFGNLRDVIREVSYSPQVHHRD